MYGPLKGKLGDLDHEDGKVLVTVDCVVSRDCCVVILGFDHGIGHVDRSLIDEANWI